MKKGDLSLETVGKLLLGLVLLIIVVLMIYYLKGKLYGDEGSLVELFKGFIRFGR